MKNKETSLSVKKIEEKLNIKEMNVNAADPCRRFWENYRICCEYDCMYDCKYNGVVSAYGSNKY